MKKFYKIFLALTLGLFLSACSQSPEDVALEFTQAMYKVDAKTAVSLLDLEGKENDENTVKQAEGKIQAMAADIASKAEKNGGVKDIVVVETKENGENELSVTVKVTYGDGTEKEEFVKLVNKNGKWLVNL